MCVCLSYTLCNSYKLAHFLHYRFLRNLTVKKNIIKCYYFPPSYLINTSILSLYCSLFIAFHHIIFSSTQSNKKN